MNITSNFDSGNIEVISIEKPEDIQLKIRKDTNSHFFQWFYFRVIGASGYPCQYKILNASESAYPAWGAYQAVASYDNENWFRVPTVYENGQLIIQHQPEYNSVYYAYFAPYSYERHLKLIGEAQKSNLCVLQHVGETVENRNIDCLIIGTPDEDKKKIWIIARQHPGESMAEWFMEGVIKRLIDTNDPVSQKLLDKAVFYIVPNMNVDGSIHGNLRTNSLGVNYNREWNEPSLDKSPEVYHIRNMMDKVGLDMCLDIHGDEELPYNFVSRNEGIPKYTKRIENLEQRFLDAWLSVSPDFQDKVGYPKAEKGKANMSVCAKHIAQRFDCLSLTIEMPFKDNADMPNPLYGWSPERSVHLGESVLTAVLQVAEQLR